MLWGLVMQIIRYVQSFARSGHEINRESLLEAAKSNGSSQWLLTIFYIPYSEYSLSWSRETRCGPPTNLAKVIFEWGTLMWKVVPPRKYPGCSPHRLRLLVNTQLRTPRYMGVLRDFTMVCIVEILRDVGRWKPILTARTEQGAGFDAPSGDNELGRHDGMQVVHGHGTKFLLAGHSLPAELFLQKEGARLPMWRLYRRCAPCNHLLR